MKIANLLASSLVALACNSAMAEPTPAAPSGTFSEGGPGKVCSTPLYRCSKSPRQIGCRSAAKDEHFISHCEATMVNVELVNVEMVNCYVTDLNGNVVSHFTDACP